MAKLSKEELIQKIDSLSLTDDEKISLMEDISDSMNVDNSELDSVKAELEKALMNVEDLKAKYKARFLSGEVMVEDKKEDETKAEEVVDPEMKEEEVVDVKDIFTEDEKKEDEE